MGIAKQETLPSGRSQASTPTKTSPIETLAAAAAASASNEETPSNYSSLLDIGQAYGIWNPGEDNSNDARDLKIVEDDEEEELEDNATPESPKMLTQVRNLNFWTLTPRSFLLFCSTNHPILGVRGFRLPHTAGRCTRLNGKQQQRLHRKIFGRAEGDSHGDCLTGISQTVLALQIADFRKHSQSTELQNNKFLEISSIVKIGQNQKCISAL